MKIRRYDSEMRIPLPNAYSQQFIPVAHCRILIPETAKSGGPQLKKLLTIFLNTKTVKLGGWLDIVAPMLWCPEIAS